MIDDLRFGMKKRTSRKGAKLAKKVRRKVFSGTWEILQKMPVQTDGPFAQEIVRADRDGRGW